MTELEDIEQRLQRFTQKPTGGTRVAHGTTPACWGTVLGSRTGLGEQYRLMFEDPSLVIALWDGTCSIGCVALRDLTHIEVPELGVLRKAHLVERRDRLRAQQRLSPGSRIVSVRDQWVPNAGRVQSRPGIVLSPMTGCLSKDAYAQLRHPSMLAVCWTDTGQLALVHADEVKVQS